MIILKKITTDEKEYNPLWRKTTYSSRLLHEANSWAISPKNEKKVSKMTFGLITYISLYSIGQLIYLIDIYIYIHIPVYRKWLSRDLVKIPLFQGILSFLVLYFCFSSYIQNWWEIKGEVEDPSQCPCCIFVASVRYEYASHACLLIPWRHKASACVVEEESGW